MFKFTKINFLFFAFLLLFGFTFVNFPAYSHWHTYPHWHNPPHWDVPPPILHPIPNPTICPYGYGSTCVTASGTCVRFIINPQPRWVSTCIGNIPFRFCFNVQVNSRPFAEEACYVKYSDCSCSHEKIYYHPIYGNPIGTYTDYEFGYII